MGYIQLTLILSMQNKQNSFFVRVKMFNIFNPTNYNKKSAIKWVNLVFPLYNTEMLL